MTHPFNKRAGWLKPLLPRNPKEAHRVATSLELLFDLIFVVAVATAGQQLHHSIIENHFIHGLTMYFMVFFALWWAWMNFSWFASAYDNDDALYRILSFIQIIGSLVIAAGIPLAFTQQNFDIMIIGYIVMRSSLVIQWFRVAKNDLVRRKTALRYAFGIICLEVGWVLFHFIEHQYYYLSFIVLVLAELSVPIYAESYKMTPWHPEHIAERYSLLTIIVLGESVVGCFRAILDALNNTNLSLELLFLMLGGLMMMFTMWWAYFDHDIAPRLNSRKVAFFWGYGHFFIFISIAAIGAGLAASVDVLSHKYDISEIFVSYFVAFSLITYNTILWLLNDAFYLKGFKKCLYPITTIIVLCTPLVINSIGYCIFFMAILSSLRFILAKQFR